MLFQKKKLQELHLFYDTKSAYRKSLFCKKFTDNCLLKGILQTMTLKSEMGLQCVHLWLNI